MLKYSVHRFLSEGSKVNQFLMAILLVVPAFSYGICIGWLSPMGPLLMSDHGPSPTPIAEFVISWMAAIPFIVGIFAVFVFGFLIDYFGRKSSLLLSSFAMVMCWSLKLYSIEPWALITARAIGGLGICGAYVVAPSYIKEISEDSVRGTLGSLVILSQNLGNLFAYLIGEYLSYNTVLWICLGVPLLHIVLFLTMPESPSYLLKCKKEEKARNALAWLRCRHPDNDVVVAEIKYLSLEMDKYKPGIMDVIRTIFREKATRRAFRITFIITIGREFCGCQSVIHYASLIFKTASGGSFILSANQQAVVLGAVQLLGSCMASSLMERTGRRPLLGTTCFFSGITMFALGTWFYMHANNMLGSVPVAWLPIAALCLCIFCDAGGLQPVPFVIMTEIFPFQVRGKITSVLISFTCLLVSIQLRAFQPVINALGIHIAFFIFAGVCFVTTVYTYFYVPETKRRSIEEIYRDLCGGEKICESVITKL